MDDKYTMEIYVLFQEDAKGSEKIVCVSEDINKIYKSFFVNINPDGGDPELEIWTDGHMIYGTKGKHVLDKIEEEIARLQ